MRGTHIILPLLKPPCMTDTERLDWLARRLGAVICSQIFDAGFRIPITGGLRETIDAAKLDQDRRREAPAEGDG